MSSGGKRFRHEPALDGFRGLAVAAVVLFHLAELNRSAGLDRLAHGGFLAVSAFFALSGFLLVSLMLGEFETSGRIDARAFWARRLRRLMPAALLTLATVGLLARWVGPKQQLTQLPGDVAAAVGYVANWRFIATGTDYAALFATVQSPVKHLWSLSIEEQWYLLLPVVVGLLLGWRRGRLHGLVALLVGGSVASIALTWRLGGGEYSPRVYFGTDTRFSEMAIGALAAVWWVYWSRRSTGTGGPAGERGAGAPAAAALTADSATRARAVAAAGRRVLGEAVSVAALIGLVASWALTDLRDSWLYRGGFGLHALGCAVVLLAALQPGWLVNRVLSFTPLAALGRRSYGVYLLHWPIILWLTPEVLHCPVWLAAILQVGVTLVVAMASYRWFEQPIRQGRMVLEWRRLAVPVGALSLVAGLVWSMPEVDQSTESALGSSDAVVLPKQQRVSVTQSSTSVTTSSTTTTVPLPPLKVMVVGDSFGMSLGAGLKKYADTYGTTQVDLQTVVGCPFARGGPTRTLNFELTPSNYCKQRDATLTARVAEFQPDVVVLAGGMWDQGDRRPTGFRTWVHIGQPAYDAYLQSELTHLADIVQAGGASVVWMNSPHWNPKYSKANFMGPPPYKVADPARPNRFNEILAAALAGRPATQIVDIAGWLASQPGGEFAPDLRADGVHLTNVGAGSAAVWLEPILSAARPTR